MFGIKLEGIPGGRRPGGVKLGVAININIPLEEPRVPGAVVSPSSYTPCRKKHVQEGVSSQDG